MSRFTGFKQKVQILGFDLMVALKEKLRDQFSLQFILMGTVECVNQMSSIQQSDGAIERM